MSIETIAGEFIATCDICGEQLQSKRMFLDAVQTKRDAGWKIKKTEWGYEDICPECDGGMA